MPFTIPRTMILLIIRGFPSEFNDSCHLKFMTDPRILFCGRKGNLLICPSEGSVDELHQGP